MKEKNNFALVRKPSSAIQKTAPRTKRILSGIVADALALAKPTFTVLMCAAELSDIVELLIKKDWEQKYTLKFIRFNSASELLNLARKPFNLIFVYVMNVQLDTDERDPFKFLGALKAKYGKPIIATQGLDWTKNFEGTGVAFLNAPFTVETIQNVLTKIFLTQTADATTLTNKAHSIRIVIVNDESDISQLLNAAIQSYFKDVTTLFFENGATALKELSQITPDLLVTDHRMAGMDGLELCHHLLRQRVQYPIILTSSWDTTDLFTSLRQLANRGLNLSFLPVPCDMESLVKAVETALKIPRAEGRTKIASASK